MQKSRMWADTEQENTIYSICMYQNLPFFMTKSPKMAVFCQTLSSFGLRPAISDPRPYFEGAGCGEAGSRCIYMTKA